jgi:hypothetical protein
MISTEFIYKVINNSYLKKEIEDITNNIHVEEVGIPHSIYNLPKNTMAVYMFFYKDICLKVGKVNANSNARFTSQHYSPNSAKSTLAKSLLTANEYKYLNLTDKNIGEWIKNNTQRLNILMDKSLGVFVLNYLEALFQLQFKPSFEGFVSQR